MRYASTRFAVPLIVVASALALVPSLFTRDPWNPDEPRAVEVSREMVALGNYLVPHLNGEPYSDKPPVFYWLAAGFWRLGCGVNSGRMVSLLATTGTLLLVYALGRRLHSPEAGLLAALITLTTLLFPYIGKFGVLDPLLTCFTTASICCVVRAFEGGERRGRWWLAAYALTALAVLTKGPAGLVVPLLVAAAYGVLRRRGAAKGGWWHLAGAALMLALVAAWLVPACIQGGPGYTKNILFQQTAQRVGEEASHYQAPYFYFLYSPVFFLPWTLVLVPALLWGLRAARVRSDRAAGLAAAWFLVVLLFFSLFSGKRERYLLPLVPAVGLLCARYVVAVIQGELLALRGHRGLWKAAFVLLGLVAIGLVVVALEPAAIVRKFPNDAAVLAELKAAMTPAVLVGAGVAGAVMLAACFYGIHLPHGAAGEQRRVLAAVAAMLVLSLAIDILATPILDRLKSGRDLVEEAGPYLREPFEVVLYQSDYSGVYNLFARRTHMQVVRDEKGGRSGEQQLRGLLRPGRPMAIIAKESKQTSLADLAARLGLREVARERVGHKRVAVLTPRKP